MLVTCSSVADGFVVLVTSGSVVAVGSLVSFIVVVVSADVSVSVVYVVVTSAVDDSAVTPNVVFSLVVVVVMEDPSVNVLEKNSVEDSVIVTFAVVGDVVLSEDGGVVFSEDGEMVVPSLLVIVDMVSVVSIDESDVDSDCVVETDVEVVSTLLKYAIVRKTVIHMVLICQQYKSITIIRMKIKSSVTKKKRNTHRTYHYHLFFSSFFFVCFGNEILWHKVLVFQKVKSEREK